MKRNSPPLGKHSECKSTQIGISISVPIGARKRKSLVTNREHEIQSGDVAFVPNVWPPGGSKGPDRFPQAKGCIVGKED